MESVAGSNAYGTNTPESDRDIRGVFIQPLNDILKYGFVEQVSDEKNDVTFYELGRFMHLIAGNNPNILELLAAPEDCIIYKDPLFEMIEKCKEDFLSKKVRWTFAGYAIEQIRKARGYNKKMNWEEKEMTRKTVLDFCYILEKGGSIPFKKFLEEINIHYPGGFTQKDFGLAAIDHAQDLYAMYIAPRREEWGIVSNEETANDVQLTSIPKDIPVTHYLSFNKNGYSSHCIKYKEYQIWLKERNVNRFKMNKEHGKNYDSKNMCHTYRLLSMAHELSTGELRVRRTEEEIEKLMKIRHGEYEYEDLLKEAEAMIAGLDTAFEASKLPDKPNDEKIKKILFDIRKYYYKL